MCLFMLFLHHLLCSGGPTGLLVGVELFDVLVGGCLFLLIFVTLRLVDRVVPTTPLVLFDGLLYIIALERPFKQAPDF